MGSMPFAFSVHNFISSVGADAGFAAIIGLAILVLLYFAHARETANLREEAAVLAARLQQAEARVAELSRPQPVAVPAPEAVQVRDQRAAGAAPFAPAGVAAPALASATHVVPIPEPASVASSPPAAPERAVAMAAAPAPAALPRVAAAPSAPPAAAGSLPPVAAPPQTSLQPEPAPSPTPAAASGVISPPPPARDIPGPATAAGANGGRGAAPSPSPPPISSRGPAGGVGARPPRQLPSLGPPASGGRSPARRIVLGLGAVLLVAAAAVALVALTSSSSTSPGTSNPTRTTNAPAAKRAMPFTPSAVTVSVLNGTATNQLAHHVAARLAAEGYRKGRIATAANQTESTTVVAYRPGRANRTDALHVATALNLRPTAVRPIDQGTQQVACPPPGACAANVVVTVGADLATL